MASDAPCSRWNVLALYMILGFTNQAMWLTFAPVASSVSKRYEVSDAAVTALAASGALLYLPGSWICARAVATGGLRRAVLVACWLQTIGSLIRLLADAFLRLWSPECAYVALFVGQNLASMAAPGFMNTPVGLAQAWFPDDERDPAIAAAVLSPLLGEGAGAALTAVFVTGESAQGLGQWLMLQFTLCVVLMVWGWCGFHSEPSHVASSRAGTASVDPDMSTVTAWMRALRQTQFLLLMLILSVGLSFAATLLSLFGQILENCDYTEGFAGAASGIFILAGAFGNLASGFMLRRSHSYKPAVRGTVCLAVCSCFALIVTLAPGRSISILAAAAVAGLLLQSTIPAIIGSAIEETYPVPSDAATGLLFVSAQICILIFTPVSQVLLDMQHGSCGTIFSPVRIFFSAAAIFGALLPAILHRRGRTATARAMTEARGDFIG